ncbi:MAG: CAP domain-containing protein, partial [Marinomonas sp.]
MSTANPLELGMLALINDERAAAGLEPLRLITLLNDAAETHSAWMLETNQFSHSGDAGSSPSERMEEAGYPFEGASLALENIGWQSAHGEEGFVDDVAQVHASLMNSPGHRANILNPDARDIGIGIETGTFSSASGDF